MCARQALHRVYDVGSADSDSGRHEAFQEASRAEMNETRKRRGSLMNMFDWKSSPPVSPPTSQPPSRKTSKNSMKTSPVVADSDARLRPGGVRAPPIVVPGLAGQPPAPKGRRTSSPAPSPPPPTPLPAAKQPIAPMLMMLSLGMLLGAAMMKFLL